MSPIIIDTPGKKNRFEIVTEGLGKLQVRAFTLSVFKALRNEFPELQETDSYVFTRHLAKLTSRIIDKDGSETDAGLITIEHSEKLTSSDLEKFAKHFLENNPLIENTRSPGKKDDETFCDYLKRLFHKEVMSIKAMESKAAAEYKKHFGDLSGIGIGQTSRMMDEYRRGLESIRSSLKPYRGLHDSVQKSIKELDIGQTDQLRKVFDSLGSVNTKTQQQMKSIRESMRGLGIGQTEQLMKQLGRIPADTIRNIMKDFRSSNQAFAELEKPYLKSHDAFSKIFDQHSTIGKFFESSGVIGDSLEKILGSSTNINIGSVADEFRNSINAFSFDSVQVNDGGTLSVDGQSISAYEISESVSEFFEGVSDEASLERIFEKLKAYKSPVQLTVILIIKILLYLIYPLFLVIYAPDIQHFFNQSEFKTKREVIQKIKEAPQYFDLEEYKNYRVVTGEGLRLREKPNTKSKVFDKLYRGRLVKVLRKKRNWTFVKVTYEDQEMKTGWVFTRYIVPLKR